MQEEKKARIRQDKLEKGAAKAAEELEKCKFLVHFFLFEGLTYWFSIESYRIIRLIPQAVFVFWIQMNLVLISFIL